MAIINNINCQGSVYSDSIVWQPCRIIRSWKLWYVMTESCLHQLQSHYSSVRIEALQDLHKLHSVSKFFGQNTAVGKIYLV